MAEKSCKEHTCKNNHLEKYRSVFGSRALHFENSQATYAKEIKPLQVVF